ncbi:MAG: metal ABC transporter permease [Patescibacteria group bacterium]|nr:metal ABC transporter permease [Patescibacteria group bacterium]MCX7589915.1 metal ABC transporter permease [Patescibacteria group bacterium]MDW8279595.1 metal ABC transporter permease [bacterium]
MNNQLVLSLISGVFISGIAAYLGTLMLSRKMSVIAEPVAHLALPGAALAIIYGFDLFLGVFPFTILGALIIWLLERKTKLPIENLAAILFASSIGVALLILPIEEAEEALVGNILNISFYETIFVILISLIIFGIVFKIYNKTLLLNVSEDLAVVSEININFYNFLYLLSIALTVSIGVYLVGGLITAALIAIPAAISKNLNKSLIQYKLFSIFFGTIITIFGILLGQKFNLQPGPLIVICGAFIFLISIIFKKSN